MSHSNSARSFLFILIAVCAVLVISATINIYSNNGLESPVSLSEDSVILTPLFKDPAKVADANPFLAPDVGTRAVFNQIDDTRDRFLQLQGSLMAKTKDEDCDGIHDIAVQVQAEHEKYDLFLTQYQHMDRDDRQQIATYAQERLNHLAHHVTSELVQQMLKCQQSNADYADAVSGVGLFTARIESLRQDLLKNKKNCVELQKTFHTFTEELEDFYASVDDHLGDLRAKNMLIAEQDASLQIQSSMAPSERSFYTTFHALWENNCHKKVDKALGIAGKDAAGKDAAGKDAAGKDGEKKLASGVKLAQKFQNRKVSLFQTLAEAVSAAAAAAPPSPSPQTNNNNTAAPAPALSHSFPDQYPRTARLMLLVGTVGLAACAIIFLWMGASIRSNQMAYSVTFLFTAVAACSYFALYSGLGVTTKLDGGHHRVILSARYYDLMITMPLIALDVALFAKSDAYSAVSLMASAFFTCFSWFIGSDIAGESKFAWWCIGLFFFIMTIIQYATQISASRAKITEATVQTLQVLIGIVCFVWMVYAVTWILGSEGIGYLAFTTEVGINVFADLIAKAGFGFTVLGAFEDSPLDGEQSRLLASSRYV